MFVLSSDRTRDLLRSRQVLRPLRQMGRQLEVGKKNIVFKINVLKILMYVYEKRLPRAESGR
jgi:hypothetical protein